MAISKSIIETTNQFIERNSDILDNFPINIEQLVSNEGITLRVHDFKDEVSGLLFIQGNTKTIGVDKNSGDLRKRFTIAHELGHYILHNERSNMFVDKVFFRKNSEGYTTKEEKIEKEANYFAANILMPEKLIHNAIANLTCDLYEDDTITKLAAAFKVSNSAMSFRLINLGIL